MKRFNTRAAVIVGLPLTVIIAFFEASPAGQGNWLTFSFMTILCAVVFGVPQGYLAAVPALRRSRWRLVGLLVGMLIVGLGSAVVASSSAAALPAMGPTGHWEPLNTPPAKITKLVAPICSGHIPGVATAYAVTKVGQVFRYDSFRTPEWTAIDTLPADHCMTVVHASQTPRLPRGELSRVVIYQSGAHGYRGELHVALSIDGSLWRWQRSSGGYAVMTRASAYEFLSVVFSLLAWVAVVRTRNGALQS